MLPSFHPPDRETFITMTKLHKETCKQEKKLIRLFDMKAKTDDTVIKERALVYKMSGYFRVWGNIGY